MPSSKKDKRDREERDDKKEDKEDKKEKNEQEGGKKKKHKKQKGGKKAGSKTQRKVRVKGSNDRYFKMIDIKTGKSYGRYTGETPKQAASKSFTKLLQKLKDNGKSMGGKSVTIYLRESTRGSNRKVYGYKASRVKLDKPQQLTIVDKDSKEEKTITYNYRNKIHKVEVPLELKGGAKKSKSKTAGKKAKKGKSKSTKAAVGKKSKSSKKSKSGSKGKKAKGSKGKKAKKH